MHSRKNNNNSNSNNNNNNNNNNSNSNSNNNNKNNNNNLLSSMTLKNYLSSPLVFILTKILNLLLQMVRDMVCVLK